MLRHAENHFKRRNERYEGCDLMPRSVIEAVQRIVAMGKEAVVKKERGKWVVLEQSKRLVYKEP